MQPTEAPIHLEPNRCKPNRAYPPLSLMLMVIRASTRKDNMTPKLYSTPCSIRVEARPSLILMKLSIFKDRTGIIHGAKFSKKPPAKAPKIMDIMANIRCFQWPDRGYGLVLHRLVWYRRR